MKTRLLLSSCMLTLCFTATANVVVDTSKITDANQYSLDTLQCQQLAQQVKALPAEKDGLAGRAVAGAAAGAATGAISGGSGSEGAKIGAGVAVGSGILENRRNKKDQAQQLKLAQIQAEKNCMIGRGYTVIN